MSPSGLPDAVAQNPACGACRGETRYDYDDYQFICEECQLVFDELNMSASFIDPDIPACGERCDLYWHGDNRITMGQGYECGTCALPITHTSMHWTNCRPVKIAK